MFLTNLIIRILILTRYGINEWVEERYNKIDKNSAIEQNVAPKWHVTAHPEKHRLST